MLKKIQFIKQLKKEGYTLDEIGAKMKPKITGERVRQLLTPRKLAYCKKHKTHYETSECIYCKVEKEYPQVLTSLARRSAFELLVEFERLSRHDRSRASVIQRALLIKFMKDKQGKTLTQISKFLKRDYTSVKNLYVKKI